MTRRRRAALREILHQASRTRVLTPDAVFAYAELHLSRDDGAPIRPAAHHRLWVELCCDWRIRTLLLVAPPEAAKTTWILNAYLGARVGVFPEDNVILASTSGKVAIDRSTALRNAVETASWRESFPGVLPARGMPWQHDKWSLAPLGIPRPGRLHHSVAAYGTGGSIIGSRANEIVADDLLDEDNTRTQHQRQLVTRWAHTSLLSRRKSRVGRAVVIGTAWHHDDIYQDLAKKPGWVTCRIPLLSEATDVYAFLTYPDDWPHPKLGVPIGQAELERLTRLEAA